MADKAVSALTQVVNHAAIGNCLMVAQKGAGAGSTNCASVSSLQVNYTQVANAYPNGNGDGNAYGVRTVSSNNVYPAFQTINDTWYNIATRSDYTLSYSTVFVMNQSTNAFVLAPSMYVKQAGAWTQVKEAWIKDSGVWHKFLYVEPVTYITITGGYNINLRSVYQTQTGDYSATPVSVHFLVTGNIGSTSTGAYALDTGDWPAGSSVKLTNNAIIAGAGGTGGVPYLFSGRGPAGPHCIPGNTCGPGWNSQNGFPGGPAMYLRYNLTCINNYVIGGGGGGGGGGIRSWSVYSVHIMAGGGGGAGITAGAASGCGNTQGSYCPDGGGAGTEFTGGYGGAAGVSSGGQNYYAYGGYGGNLGSVGAGGTPLYPCSYPGNYQFSCPGFGGAAGVAIARNGNTLTLTGQTTQVYGAIT